MFTIQNEEFESVCTAAIVSASVTDSATIFCMPLEVKKNNRSNEAIRLIHSIISHWIRVKGKEFEQNRALKFSKSTLQIREKIKALETKIVGQTKLLAGMYVLFF